MITRDGPAAVISAAREDVLQQSNSRANHAMAEQSSHDALQRLVVSSAGLLKRAAWSEAQQLLRRALKGCEIQIDQAKDLAASSLAEGASSKRNSVLGQLNLTLSELLPMLAKTYSEQDELDTACSLLQRALDLIEVTQGIDAKTLPMILHEFAKATHEVASRLRHQWGAEKAAAGIQQAERLYKCAVTAADGAAERHGPQEMRTQFHYSSFSRFYLKEDNLEMAEKLAKISIEKCTRVWGKDHVETQECVDALADILSKRRNFAEAEPLHAQIVEVLRKALPADSIEIAYALEDLGRDLQGIGDLAKAQAALDESLKIVRSLCPEEDFDSVYIVRASLLRLCGEVNQQLAHQEVRRDRRQKKLNVAVNMFEKALKNIVQQIGAEHPDVQPHLRSLAVCYQAADRSSDAVPLNEKVLLYEHNRLTRQKLHDIRHVLQSSAGNAQAESSKLRVIKAKTDVARAVAALQLNKRVVERADRKVKRHAADIDEAKKLNASELRELRRKHAEIMQTISTAKLPRAEHEATMQSRRCMRNIEGLVVEVQEAVAKSQGESRMRHKEQEHAHRDHHRLEHILTKTQEAVPVLAMAFGKHYELLFKRAFVLLDDDGSGSLDRNEIRKILILLELDVSDEEFDKMIGSVDDDGSGDISCDEFVKLMVTRSIDECC